jgi:hypothetical protein
MHPVVSAWPDIAMTSGSDQFRWKQTQRTLKIPHLLNGELMAFPFPQPPLSLIFPCSNLNPTAFPFLQMPLSLILPDSNLNLTAFPFLQQLLSLILFILHPGRCSLPGHIRLQMMHALSIRKST